MRLRESLGACFVVLLLFAAACGAPDRPEARPIRLWTHWDGRELDILKDELARYEQAHPDVRVDLAARVFDTFSLEIEQAIRQGSPRAPDVFTGINDWIGNFAEKNILVPIDNLPGEMPDEFLSYAYEAVQYKGKLYAFPLSYECIALFYNRKLVKSPPAAFDAWIKSAKSFTRPDQDQWGLACDLGQPYFTMPFLLAGGSTLLQPDGHPALNWPDKIHWLELVALLQNEHGVVPPRVSGAQSRARDLFASGRAAYFIGGPWDVPPLVESKLDFGIARLPKMPNGVWSPPLIGVKGLFLTGKGDRPESRDLIRYLGRAALQRRFAVETARIPSLKIVYDDPVIVKNAHLMAFADQATVGEAMPNAPEIFAVWRPLQDMAFIPHLEGRVTAEAGLGAAQTAAAEDIRRYRAELASW